MQTIALLGTGTMGAGLAANWLAKGFAVTVWNRTAGRAEALRDKGARVAGTPKDAAAGADFVVAMVADDGASKAVWLGPDGALGGAKPGAVAIEMSTLSPGFVRELAVAAKARGLGFLDVPVAGSKAAAAAGQLTLFAGGEAPTLAAARPVLDAVAKEIHLMGPVGAGVTWKLINNMLVAVQVAAAAEAVALAEKAGFDRTKATELIGGGGLGSPLVKMKMPRMAALDFGHADFALRHMAKDLRYADALAAGLAARTPIAAAAASVYGDAEATGHGEEDFAAVLAASRR
jgi:3-hydroxyisobutyrate dehydrogenase